MDIRTGFGYDIHRLEKGEGILLAGISIPCPYRVVAHSDGDIVFHALAQSILSALGKDDIGTYFPDTLKKTENMSSSLLVNKALEEMKKMGYRLSNLVIDIVTEAPKLMPYKHSIKESLSTILGLEEDRIAVHANTHEGLGDIGKKEAIACFANVLLVS